MIKTRLAAGVISLATVVTVAGCSSSGSSGGVSQSQLVAKLKQDPSISALSKSGGAKAAVVNKLVDCAAKALAKDANSTDLQNYVKGKITLKQVKPKSSSAKDDATGAIAACEKSAVKSAG